MTHKELLRYQRLLSYEMYGKSTINTLVDMKTYKVRYGKLVNVNGYNGNPYKPGQPKGFPVDNWLYPENIPISWSNLKITKDGYDNYHEMLKKHVHHQLREIIPMSTDKIRKYGWLVPLHFISWENNKPNHIIMMPPEEGATTRTVYINGTINGKRPDMMYTDDWYYIMMTPEEIKRGGLTLKPKSNNTIYKYLEKVHIMTTQDLMNLLKKQALHFEYDGMDILVLSTDILPHEVYVNGIEQYSIPYNSELHRKWFPSAKDCNHERLCFRNDWRILLKLNSLNVDASRSENILPKYFKGVVEYPSEFIKTKRRKNRQLTAICAVEYIRHQLKAV